MDPIQIPVRSKYRNHTVKKMSSKSGGTSSKSKRTKVSAAARANLKPQPKMALHIPAKGKRKMIVLDE